MYTICVQNLGRHAGLHGGLIVCMLAMLLGLPKNFTFELLRAVTGE